MVIKNNNKYSCDCSFYNQMFLPCFHLILLLNSLNIDFYILINDKWFFENINDNLFLKIFNNINLNNNVENNDNIKNYVDNNNNVNNNNNNKNNKNVNNNNDVNNNLINDNNNNNPNVLLSNLSNNNKFLKNKDLCNSLFQLLNNTSGKQYSEIFNSINEIIKTNFKKSSYLINSYQLDTFEFNISSTKSKSETKNSKKLHKI